METARVSTTIYAFAGIGMFMIKLAKEHSLISRETVGADLSCTSPIYRPWFSSTNFPNALLEEQDERR
jgi:hypothetical protein